VAKLKAQLKARGLPAAGAKPALVAALTAALAADTAMETTGKATGKAEPVTPAPKPVRLQS